MLSTFLGQMQEAVFPLENMGKGEIINTIGVQNEPPRNVPILVKDYCELKSVEILRVQEKLLSPAFNYLEEFKLETFPKKELLPRINFI